MHSGGRARVHGVNIGIMTHGDHRQEPAVAAPQAWNGGNAAIVARATKR